MCVEIGANETGQTVEGRSIKARKEKRTEEAFNHTWDVHRLPPEYIIHWSTHSAAQTRVAVVHNQVRFSMLQCGNV
jgi:hypothetical protein